MKNAVWKATAMVFALSLIGKLIGFVKSVIQAAYFGATVETDAFNMANGFVGNVLYMLTTALAVAFVPLYIQHKLNSRKEGRRFASMTITALSGMALVITAVLVAAAPVVVSVIAPSYTGEARSLTITYFRVIALGIIFSLLVNVYTNLLNSEKIYGYSTFCSIINSLVLIAAILIFSGKFGVWTLVVSVPVSYLIQWIFLYIRAHRFGGVTLKYGLRNPALKILAVQALPILISQATVEINQTVDRALLTSIGTGVVTAVSYSAVIYQLFSTIISTPLSTVMFTELSEAGATGDLEKIAGILRICYRILIFACLPIMAVAFFCSGDIVSIIYGHGSFTSSAVLQCSVGLMMYILCLLPQCVKLVLTRAYYALNNTRRPMFYGILEVVLNIGLSIALVRPLGIYGVVGATAIASLIFLVVLLIDFNFKFTKVMCVKEIRSYWKILAAAAAALILAFFLREYMFFNSFADLVIKGIACFAVYGAAVLLLKEPVMYAAIRKCRAFFNKKKSAS